MVAARRCRICDMPFTPTRAGGRPQVLCGSEECATENRRRLMAAFWGKRRTTPAPQPKPRPRWERPNVTARGLPRPERVLVDGREMRRCTEPGCRNLWERQVNSLGQETSRKLCDACRERKKSRSAGDLPIPSGTLRCVGCTAVIGLQWGTQTHLDSEGRCASCADWHLKAMKRESMERQGLRLRGGLVFGRAPAPRPAIRPAPVNTLTAPVQPASPPPPEPTLWESLRAEPAPPADDPDRLRFYTVPEAARRLKLPQQRIRYEIAMGYLPGERDEWGTNWIPIEAVQARLNGRAEKAS